MKKRIVVIGAGFGGPAAPSRRAAGGHELTPLQHLDALGGRGDRAPRHVRG